MKGLTAKSPYFNAESQRRRDAEGKKGLSTKERKERNMEPENTDKPQIAQKTQIGMPSTMN